MVFGLSDSGTRCASHQCPFYGFRWKENSDCLIERGGGECGLDFDTHGRCVVELAGASTDYQHCPLAQHYRSFVESTAPFIRFCRAEPRLVAAMGNDTGQHRLVE